MVWADVLYVCMWGGGFGGADVLLGCMGGVVLDLTISVLFLLELPSATKERSLFGYLELVNSSPLAHVCCSCTSLNVYTSVHIYLAPRTWALPYSRLRWEDFK